MFYNILLVDDSPIILSRMKANLIELKFISEIDVAADHEEAIRLSGIQNFNVVITDINLPGKNGIELLKHFKTFHNQTMVIMLSNQSDKVYRKLCRQLGCDHFIDKSSDFEMIPQIIEMNYKEAFEQRNQE